MKYGKSWDGKGGREMKLSPKIKRGDIKRLPNKNGDDFIVKVMDVFDYEGERWAEVKPVEFDGFSREVKACMLFEI
jgi:hypothetical protein